MAASVPEPAALEADTLADLSADELALRAQGHKGELPRQFSALATLSLAFTITNSWIGYSAVFVIPLINGGGPSVIYSLVVSFIACSIITAGLAELASAYPTTGGQYHFSFMVSSPGWRAPVSFAMGWLSVFAWWMLASSACIFCAQIIAALITIYNPDFVSAQWQIYLIYVALTIMAITLIVLLPRQLPRAEIMFFCISCLGFLVSTIVVLSRSKTKQNGRTVFVDWNNQGGWSDGVAFLIGVGQGMYSFIATDAATHVSEELPNPGRNVPRAMGLTLLIGVITVFVWTIAMMFSASDLDGIMSSPMPYMAVYLQSIGNSDVAIFFTVWLWLAYYTATISCYATSGRLVWAFARDNGLPMSDIFKKVHPTLKMPVNATLLTATFAILYGAIYVGSTTAFNSFISLAILGLNLSYVVPQGILVFRGREKILPPRHFALGKVTGAFCNVFSTLWVALYAVIFCFPSFLPVEASNMNYLSVIAVGVMAFVAVMWWTVKRHTFTGPNVQFADSTLSTVLTGMSAGTAEVHIQSSESLKKE